MAQLFVRCLKLFLLNFYHVETKQNTAETKQTNKLNNSALKMASSQQPPNVVTYNFSLRDQKKKPSKKQIIMLKTDKEPGSRMQTKFTLIIRVQAEMKKTALACLGFTI